MAWVRLDDGFYDHPKVAALSDAGFRLWLGLIAYSARYGTDGVVTWRQVVRVYGSLDGPRAGLEEGAPRASGGSPRGRAVGRRVAELVRRGLLHPIDPDDDGRRWALHDWQDYQPSSEEVRALRRARADAGRSGGLESGRRRRRDLNGEASAEANTEALASPLLQPRPVPSRPSSLSTSGPSHQPPVDNDEEGLVRVAREVAAELGRRDASRATGVRSQPAYALRCAATRWDTQRTALVALTRAFPERTIPELADLAEHPAKGLAPLPMCPTCSLRHTAGPCPYADDPPSEELLAAIEAELAGDDPT